MATRILVVSTLGDHTIAFDANDDLKLLGTKKEFTETAHPAPVIDLGHTFFSHPLMTATPYLLAVSCPTESSLPSFYLALPDVKLVSLEAPLIKEIPTFIKGIKIASYLLGVFELVADAHDTPEIDVVDSNRRYGLLFDTQSLAYLSS